MHDFTRRTLLQGGTALAAAGALTGPALLEFAKAWAQSAPWKAESGAKLTVMRWKRFVPAEDEAFNAMVAAFKAATGTELASLFYQPLVDQVVPVANPEIAELSKLVENTFRFVNISLMNEMAQLCDQLGVNVWQVLEAAGTKPFAYLPHWPSAGVGGHCIPIVPFYLVAAARESGARTASRRASPPARTIAYPRASVARGESACSRAPV